MLQGGGAIPDMTTTLNLSERQRSLPLSTLPKTFVDAVIITRLLGIRYLWIDSLCILQDSPSDWLQELAKMSFVYSNTMVTIAATTASNSNAGILTQKMPRKDTFNLALSYESFATKMRGTFHIRRSRSNIVQSVPWGPLTTRGWTVQEKILSSRTIHFGYEEIVWECSSRTETSADPHPQFFGAFEFRSLSLPIEIESGIRVDIVNNMGEKVQNSALKQWYTIISQYASRNLTVPSDILPAISAVAREFSQLLQAKYYAGLWREDLHRGLLWSYNGADSGPPSSPYLSPSWSWASVIFHRPLGPSSRTWPTGQLYGHTNGWKVYTTHQDFDAEILDCSIFPAHSDRFGQITSGYLLLRGACIEAVEWNETIRGNFGNGLPRFKRGRQEDLFMGSGLTEYITCVLDNIERNDLYADHLAETASDLDLERDLSFSGEEEPLPHRPDRLNQGSVNGADTCSEQECESRNSEMISYSGPDQGNNSERSHGQALKPGSIFLQVRKWTTGFMPDGVVFALLLEPTAIEGEFRRRGLARVPEVNGIARRGWEKRTVKII